MAKPPSTNTDRSNEIFVREVDDAVRRSDREDFFQRYGWWLLGLVVLILAAWGGYIFWQNQQAENRGETAESYIHALDAVQNGPVGENADEAMATFETIGAEGSPGYRAASLMMRANMLGARGETPSAVAIYDEIAGDGDLPGPFRDLAKVRATMLQFDDLPPSEVVERLQPLAEPGKAFFGTAGEMVGLAQMELGNNKEAGELFARIARDDGVPDEIRGRATLMANQLGVDLDPQSENLRQQVRGVQPAESGSGTQTPAE